MPREWTDDDSATDAAEPWRALGETAGDPPWLFGATDLMIAWKPDQASDAARWDRFLGATSPAVAAAPATKSVEVWDAEAAELAVDCLFQFIHALERGDVEQAMQCVAPDYHTFEDDRDMDRDALRLRLESQIDRWGEAPHISLTEVPDPIFHPVGILLAVTIQIDYNSQADRRKITDLIARVAVFEEVTAGRWLITALSPVC